MFCDTNAALIQDSQFSKNENSSKALQRDYREDLFRPSFDLFVPRLAEHITSRYGVRVSFTPLSDGAKAIFDGASIRLNDAIEAESQAFLILHLTGHAYQLGAFGLVEEFEGDFFDLRSHPGNELRVRQFETEASRYGAGLLVELNKEEMISWLEVVAARDLEYFIHFCKTGDVDFDPETHVVNPLRLEPLRLQTFQPFQGHEGVII